MIDIHSHLIFDVDDGSNTYKESLRMALEAEKLGFNKIIATPHYSKGYSPDNKLSLHFLKLKSGLLDCDIDIQLGYEVIIDDISYEGEKETIDLTLGNTNCMLFELPFHLMPPYIDEKLMEMHKDNIIPIIAHPERYRFFYKNLDNYISFIEKGCLVQVNAGSIIGAYGHEVKSFSKKILQMGLVDFIASDAHSPEDYTNRYPKAYEQVKKWVGQSYTDQLFYHNQSFYFTN